MQMFMILNCNNNLVRKSVLSSVHRFNLAGGLITLVERRSVVSLVIGPGVVAGLAAREVGVACSLVGVQFQRGCHSATLWSPL